MNGMHMTAAICAANRKRSDHVSSQPCAILSSRAASKAVSDMDTLATKVQGGRNGDPCSSHLPARLRLPNLHAVLGSRDGHCAVRVLSTRVESDRMGTKPQEVRRCSRGSTSPGSRGPRGPPGETRFHDRRQTITVSPAITATNWAG